MPAFVNGVSTASSTAVSSLTINTPSSLVAGNKLVAYIYGGGATAYSAAPSGWALLGKANEGTGGMMAVYWRDVTGSESASYSFGCTSTGWMAGAICQYSGVLAGASGFDGVPVFALNLSSVTTGDLPAITAASASELWVGAVGTYDGVTISTPPTSFTLETADSLAGDDGITVWGATATSGSNGPANWTFDNGGADIWGSVSVLLTNTAVGEYSAVLYEADAALWTNVEVGFTTTSAYGTMIVDALTPAGGQTVGLGATVSQKFANVNTNTVNLSANGSSVLVLAINAETSSGSWDVSAISAPGLTFAKRADLSVATATGTQRSQVWWAAVSTAFNGSIAITLSAYVNTGTIHAWSVDGANTTSPFDPTNPTTVSGTGTAGPLTVTFSTSHPGCFIYAVGADPGRSAIWTNYTPVAAPTITQLSPPAGPAAGGTTVTITGQHLTTATAVNFGATAAASFTVVSDTQITAITPAESSGTVDVSITNMGGTSSTSSADHFKYYTPVTYRVGSVGSGAVTIPNTVQVGDYMLLFTYGFTSAPSPSGWTVLQGPTTNPNPDLNGVAFYRVAQAGDAGSTVTLVGATNSVVVAYYNVSGIETSSVAFSSSTTNPQSPAMNTTTYGDVDVYSWGLETAPASWPSQLTLREAV